jgi:hypothetical protein
MPWTTVPSAVFHHPTALVLPVRGILRATAFDPQRARDFNSAGSSELGLQAPRGVEEALETPPSATTRIQDAGHCQLESRKTMIRFIARLFTIKY